MPSAAARRVYEDQIPSFMSVFDLDAETMADRDTVTVVDPRLVGADTKQSILANPSQSLSHAAAPPADATHRHNGSTSTQNSESAESSPTTTLSTTDSSPLTDPSPSSSPDSPTSLVPLNRYPATSFGRPTSNLAQAQPLVQVPETEPAPAMLGNGSAGRPMTSPGPRRPRNMKGLSIQPPPSANTNTNGAMASEPPSPSFIRPKIPTMKRKPSMLSLNTNTTELAPKPAAEVPQSPGLPPILRRRALKHSTSSPHMLSGTKSAAFGPGGGMTLPNMLERNESGLSEVLRPMKTSMNTTFETSITEEPSPIKSQLASRMDVEPYHEKVNNEDEKTPGYPDGPIPIYDDNVFLYLEPTSEEAAQFDVVINVAKEVKNPFDREETTSRPPQFRVTPAQESPIPDTALTDASFATAFEVQPADSRSPSETPTTPKANPFKQRPEYIHVPWDHNTDISPDLMNLCDTIEDRTRRGKRVLIHCQQGASRSASLIIAYGLYRRPELSVNDAYYAAQSKSQWISPNMKLMYSLQDFQKELSQKRLPPASAYRPRTGRSPTKHRLTLSADALGVSPKEPRTAPLPGEEDGPDRNHLGPAETHRRGNSMPGPQDVSPGPASAPPNFTWREEVEKATPPAQQELAVPKISLLPERPRQPPHNDEQAPFPRLRMRASFEPPPTPGFTGLPGFTFQNKAFPRFSNSARLSRDKEALMGSAAQEPPLNDMPVERAVTATAPTYDDDAIMSPRAETMIGNPLHNFTGRSVSGMRFSESPPTPGEDLFSPRATMFPRDPMAPFGRPSQVADPRSPPTKGETPIVRSIDDIL